MSLRTGACFLASERRQASPAENRAREASMGLLAEQNALLRLCFHLQRSERMLFEQTKRKGRARGGRAVRQVERERQRLGRELHTGVGQALAAIRMQLHVIATF